MYASRYSSTYVAVIKFKRKNPIKKIYMVINIRTKIFISKSLKSKIPITTIKRVTKLLRNSVNYTILEPKTVIAIRVNPVIIKKIKKKFRNI